MTDNIVALYTAGQSTRKIAAATGVHVYTIQRRLNKAGIKLRICGNRDVRCYLPMHLVLVDYANGTSMRALRQRYGVSHVTLAKKIVSLGVALKAKTYRNAHDRSRRNWEYKVKYQISLDQYETLLHKQGGVCAVCRQSCATGKRLAVDHDHKTGVVRGLLCYSCNIGVGFFQDDITSLKRAVEYLEETRGEM